MDQSQIEKYLTLLKSENDTDALMALRGLQNLFREAGTSLENGLRHAAEQIAFLAPEQEKEKTVMTTSSLAVQTTIATTGTMPDFQARAGAFDIVAGGRVEKVVLPGAAAADAPVVSMNMKDAVAAAIVNKSKFKLKLVDIKNNRGEIVETVLQAEYDRAGMVPIRIWAHNRGEVGALAAVLRKCVASAFPDLAA